MRKRAPLPQTSYATKISAWPPVDQRCYPRGGDACHNNTYELRKDAKLLKDNYKEIMIYFVESISHIQLYDHSLFLSLNTVVYALIHYNNIICNLSFWDKATLVFRDDGRQNSFQSICQDFHDDFIGGVA